MAVQVLIRRKFVKDKAEAISPLMVKLRSLGINPPGIQKPNITEEMGGTPLLKYIKTRIEKIRYLNPDALRSS